MYVRVSPARMHDEKVIVQFRGCGRRRVEFIDPPAWILDGYVGVLTGWQVLLGGIDGDSAKYQFPAEREYFLQYPVNVLFGAMFQHVG